MFIAVSLMILLPGNAQAAAAQTDAAPGFSADQAYNHARQLSQKIGPRPAGSAGEVKAAQYIRYVLEQSGWKVKDQPFSKMVVTEGIPLLHKEQKVEMINSQNVIAELPGTTPKYIVIGAHYDTADSSVPGAVDNASGVGVLLELARILAQEKHEMGYQLVFFGAEEKGLVGSSYYVSQADLSAVDWMLNLDMIGTPLEIDGAGSVSAPSELIDKVTELARKNNIPFQLSGDQMVMARESTQGGASDFSPFLKQGIPAVGLGIAGRPSGYYHRPEDTIDRLSLTELQRVGDFALQLVHSVSLNKVGERTWDEFYLPFQLGNHIITLPSLALRIGYLLVFLFTAVVIWKVMKLPRPGWRKYLWTGLCVLTVGLLTVVLSSAGELLWLAVKREGKLWQAYPQVFLAARIGIMTLMVLIFLPLIKKLPIARAPKVAWSLATAALLLISTFTALLRVDLAFPFVFWLFCLALQWKIHSPLLALAGPLFVYGWHWDMLNSPQWASYYNAIYTYPLPFIIIYGLGIALLFLSLLHSLSAPTKIPWSGIFRTLKKPAMIVLPLLILALGLIPCYTGDYPQPILVKEEWLEDEPSKVSVSSDDVLPLALIRQLKPAAQWTVSPKEAIIPTLVAESPMKIEVSVSEKKEQQRALEVGVRLRYRQEPDLLTLRLESSKPFQIEQMNGFMPIDKLPKKVQLKAKEESAGKYVLDLERNLPQDSSFDLVITAESSLTCSLEGVFSQLQPALLLNIPNTSVKYQSVVKKTVTF